MMLAFWPLQGLISYKFTVHTMILIRQYERIIISQAPVVLHILYMLNTRCNISQKPINTKGKSKSISLKLRKLKDKCSASANSS
jgi:hypothetical protein